jgi:quercetin dioxygenase-like cupin family protein
MDRETLAERSDLSVELVAKIDDEAYIPGLAPLIKIARALGVRLGTLLDDHEELGPVITRAGEAIGTKRFTTGQDNTKYHKGLSFNMLAADKNGRHMEPFIVDIEPDAAQGKSTHEGEEFIYVLEGNLKLEYGADTATLKAGDSVYYDSIVPHQVFSADSQPVKILAVVYAPV